MIDNSHLPVGHSRCACGACNLRFGSVSAFDRHRVGVGGDRRCMALCDMPEHGFRQDSNGYIVVGSNPRFKGESNGY